MKAKFENFMTAESEAENTAIRMILEEYEMPGIMFVRARKAGSSFSRKETKEILFDYLKAVREMRRKILEGYIFNGMIRECRMSRSFMARG